MKVLKDLFLFYINSSIHVALAVVSLLAVTQLHFMLPWREELLFFVLFGTITAYNFIKYSGIAKFHHLGLARNLRIIQIFSLLCFLALLYYATQLRWNELVLSALLGGLTLLYALPVFKGRRNLRTIKGLKAHVIAFIWAGVTVLLPILNFRDLLDTVVLFEFMQRYLLVLVLLFPFEIRDLKFDRNHLGTIPQRIGVERTRKYGLALLVLFVIIEFFQETSAGGVIPVLVITIITGAVVLRSREDQSRYFASFWVEGIPVLWFLLLWVFETGMS